MKRSIPNPQGKETREQLRARVRARKEKRRAEATGRREVLEEMNERLARIEAALGIEDEAAESTPDDSGRDAFGELDGPGSRVSGELPEPPGNA